SAFSRLRSWPGVRWWLTSTRSAPEASQAAFTSSSLPVPIRIAGLGLSMRAVSTVATVAPADRASSANSSSSASSGAPPAWGWISSACSPLRERSNSWVGIGSRRSAQAIDMEAVPPVFNRRGAARAPRVGSGRIDRGLFAAIGGLHHPATRPHAHVARRHHGGNGVLVDHLADCVAQQDHELVEGFDHALQLDAVDQVDRDGNAFAPQRIQERILQGLSLGHGVSPAWLLLCPSG